MQDWEVKFAPEAIQELQLVVTYYENLRAGIGIDINAGGRETGATDICKPFYKSDKVP